MRSNGLCETLKSKKKKIKDINGIMIRLVKVSVSDDDVEQRAKRKN
jgi:hypothetical protein